MTRRSGHGYGQAGVYLPGVGRAKVIARDRHHGPPFCGAAQWGQLKRQNIIWRALNAKVTVTIF